MGALARMRAVLAGARGEATLHTRDRLLSPAYGTVSYMHCINEVLPSDSEVSVRANR